MRLIERRIHHVVYEEGEHSSELKMYPGEVACENQVRQHHIRAKSALGHFLYLARKPLRLRDENRNL